MRVLSLVGSFLLCAAALPLMSQPHKAHPAYLHARSDLKLARAYIEFEHKPEVQAHLHHAGEEIDAAIAEIDKAAVLDGKDLNYNPKIDDTMEKTGRIHKAVELLRSARRDIEQEEDDPAANVWRKRAFQHIETAIDACKNAGAAMGIGNF